LHIPSEATIIKCKQQLATTHATETGTFAGGAFISDPVRFVSVLCEQSSLLVVGGDSGGGHTKLGVTYSVDGVQSFATLLVYEGGDSWLELQDCRAEGLTPFVGESAAFPHIWAVLQHFIDEKKVSYSHATGCPGARWLDGGCTCTPTAQQHSPGRYLAWCHLVRG
jgi:hypothetical protein